MSAEKTKPPVPPAPESARKMRGRPPVISSEHLLEIAREVFLERGIRATTADVAARAGISEGTIFHRFKSKDALFRAAMRFDPAELPEPFAKLPEPGHGDLRASLVTLASRMLAFGRIALPMMMMSWSNPAGEFSLDKLIGRPVGYKRALGVLRGFFAREIELGRLDADAKPDVLARIFMGSLHHYCMTEIMLAQDDERCTPDAFVDSLVDVLLRGALSTASSASSTPPSNKP